MHEETVTSSGAGETERGNGGANLKVVTPKVEAAGLAQAAIPIKITDHEPPIGKGNNIVGKQNPEQGGGPASK